MSVRIGLNLGAVHVSKRVGRKKPGFLVNLLVWSIAWPIKLLILGIRAATKSRPRKTQYGHTQVMSGYGLPAHPGHPLRPSGFPAQPGWYNVNGQAWYWTGSGWLR